MAVPVLLPTSVRDETRAGITYYIVGELVPVLHVELANIPIYFEHHISCCGKIRPWRSN